MPKWEGIASAILVVLCLIVGLSLGRAWAPKPVIGVLRFESVIDQTSAADMQRLIDGAMADSSIAGVVLEIYSPGGLATSSESIYYSLLKLRSVKPLVVVIDSMAASGGYYMAIAGNRIFAQASSYVGNIGTRGGRPTDPQLSPDELSSGPYKLMGGSRFEQIHQLDLVKQAFVGNVVHQRSQAAENPLKIDAKTVAEARIYLGSEALALGLVDYEGGRSDGITEAAKLAGVTDYGVAELTNYLGISFTPALEGTEAKLKSLMAQAAPDTVWMLDSRIALPTTIDDTALDQQLSRLRANRPTSLIPHPATTLQDNLKALMPATGTENHATGDPIR
ncbi:MAG: S49 family peptidase [Chloroflexi bacterium]|nr:S49 family peptidase [Chloroflexota bacterium]